MAHRFARLKQNLFFFLLFTSLLFPALSYSIPADVTDISDHKYFEAVHHALQKAKDSVYVSMFLIIPNQRHPQSPPYILFQDLLDASKRGIKVVVRLDGSYDQPVTGKIKSYGEENMKAYLWLKEAGIDCQFTAPSKTLHDKLIVIDQEIVIEGSMNWFSRALNSNYESVTLIKSREYAGFKIERINNLRLRQKPGADMPQSGTVVISDNFLLNPDLGAKLAHTRSEKSFDTYLFFLKNFQNTQEAKFDLDYKQLADYLGMPAERIERNRSDINWTLRNLKEKYKLIDYQSVPGKPAEFFSEFDLKRAA